MKRRFPIALALLVVLGAMFTAAAAAAPQVSANAERAYQIDIATNRALLHVGGADLARAEKRASRLMTPCLTRELVQLTEASPTNAHAGKATNLLSEEAGVEYEMAAITPVVRPLLNGVHRLLALQLPATVRASIKSYLAALAKVQSLNVCADAQAWLAAGLTPAHEPKGTAQIATTVATFHKLTITNVQVQLGDLPPGQVQTLKLEKTRAGQHLNQLIARSVSSLEAWIKQLLVTVEKTATTTTATGTTTT
jgi:hypothetical protein